MILVFENNFLLSFLCFVLIFRCFVFLYFFFLFFVVALFLFYFLSYFCSLCCLFFFIFYFFFWRRIVDFILKPVCLTFHDKNCNLPFLKKTINSSNWKIIMKIPHLLTIFPILLGWGYPVSIYLFKVNNKTTRGRYEIYSKLTIKTPERRHWRRSGVFVVNLEHILHLFLVFFWTSKC